MKKILLPFLKLRNLIQEKPEMSALVVALIFVVPMLIWALCLTKLPKEITLDSISEMVAGIIFTILLFACVGGMFWFMFATTFGEKKYRELSEQALKSGLEVMINQALIENGSIKRAEDMVKL